MIRKIIFVCTGNTCRSSMAEGIAKRAMENLRQGDQPVVFRSAGLAAFPGMPASEHAILVMQEQGIDIKDHQATLLNETCLAEADVVLVMTQGHKSAILSVRPELRAKVFLLSEYVNGEIMDVVDPFGCSVDRYRVCARELEQYIKKLVDRLKGL